MISQERYERLCELFTATFELSAQERAAVLAERCADDPSLRDEVEAMVARHAEDASPMDSAALGVDLAALRSCVRPATNLEGKRISHYHLKRAIGAGGMGAVYEAVQERPHRTVAVKVMNRGLRSRSSARRFEYESQILGRLRHPGIAQVFEAGTFKDNDESVPYFAMEYIPGARTISEYAKSTNLGTRERIELFIKVCHAVHHGHQKGVIHRDLKPANILVDGNGEPKIIDFGVACSTDSDMAVTTLQTDVGQLIGTLQYMSPEQCAADPHDLDTRSDIYALGVVLFELLTDQLPYDVTKSPVHEAVQAVREATPIRPSTIDRTLRGDLETITLKALEKDRERRYASAVDLAQDLRRFLNHEPIQARPPSAMYHLHRFVRRNRPMAFAAAAIVVVLVGGIVTTSRQAVIADDARQLAEQARDEEADQRAKAETDKARKEAVYEFMHEMITGEATGDPALTAVELRGLTVSEMVHRAAATIDGEFPDQPLVEAEVRYMILGMYYKFGDYHLAEPHAREMVAIRERELGEDDPETLVAVNILAEMVQYQHGRNAEAARLYRRVLDSRHRVLGEEHYLTVEAMGNLGLMLQEDGRAKEAEPLHRRAVEGNRRIFGDESQETLTSMNNLALALSRQGKLADAEPLYKRTLEIGRRTAGNEGSISKINNLAWHYLDMGKPTEAEPLFRELLDLSRRVHGETHPRIVLSTDSLATALRMMDRFDEGERLLRQTLDTVRDQLGNEHPTTLLGMNRLALLLQKAEKAQKYAEAEPLLREALEIRLRTQGDHNPATANAMHNLAMQLRWQGDLAASEPLFDQAIELYRQIGGEEHWGTLHALDNYAGLLGDLDRPAEAEEVCRQVLEVRQRVLGDEDPATLLSMSRLATLYHKQGRNEHAEPLFRQVLESNRRRHGEEHSNTIGSMVNLALAWREMGKLEQAEALCREAIETAMRVLPADDRIIAMCQSGYGACLTKLEQFPEAEERLLAAYERLKETIGEGEQQTLQRLVELYEAWGKPDEAAQWRAKLFELADDAAPDS
ncbi:MAG: serine/threonine-protein kinase [Phycisphaerales bacterium]